MQPNRIDIDYQTYNFYNIKRSQNLMSSFTELKVGLHLFMLFGSHADNVAPFSFLKISLTFHD